MNSVGIVGFGRFGKILANILQKGFAIKAYAPKPTGPFPGVQFSNLDTVLMEKAISSPYLLDILKQQLLISLKE